MGSLTYSLARGPIICLDISDGQPHRGERLVSRQIENLQLVHCHHMQLSRKEGSCAVTLPFSHTVELGNARIQRFSEINSGNKLFGIPSTAVQIGAKALQGVAVWCCVPISCAGPRRCAESVDDL